MQQCLLLSSLSVVRGLLHGEHCLFHVSWTFQLPYATRKIHLQQMPYMNLAHSLLMKETLIWSQKHSCIYYSTLCQTVCFINPWVQFLSFLLVKFCHLSPSLSLNLIVVQTPLQQDQEFYYLLVLFCFETFSAWSTLASGGGSHFAIFITYLSIFTADYICRTSVFYHRIIRIYKLLFSLSSTLYYILTIKHPLDKWQLMSNICCQQ